jgi:L-2-hydroxyglutarate oxidase LhgO
MEVLDAVVIGAGVVGLAIGRALALAGREVVILEKAAAIGTETSSRNSEVIHTGLYYSPGSLKAGLCVSGRAMLYHYCERNGIPYRRCGKLIVATSDGQVQQLASLHAGARANGVDDLAFLRHDEVHSLEPEVRCAAGLLSPSSGIIDSHAYMLSLHGDIEAAGGMISFETPVLEGRLQEDGVLLRTGGAEGVEFKAGLVVNSAGLCAQKVARSIEGLPDDAIPPLHLAKGSYFTLAGPSPFKHLVYPMPSGGGLGVHATLDLAGHVRFGPDVEWVENVDYSIDPERGAAFYAAIRDYWPALRDAALMPAYSGVRPKVDRPGGPRTDFIVHASFKAGERGVVSLYGIESPGLTCSLALADLVVGIASGQSCQSQPRANVQPISL